MQCRFSVHSTLAFTLLFHAVKWPLSDCAYFASTSRRFSLMNPSECYPSDPSGPQMRSVLTEAVRSSPTKHDAELDPCSYERLMSPAERDELDRRIQGCSADEQPENFAENYQVCCSNAFMALVVSHVTSTHTSVCVQNGTAASTGPASLSPDRCARTVIRTHIV